MSRPCTPSAGARKPVLGAAVVALAGLLAVALASAAGAANLTAPRITVTAPTQVVTGMSAAVTASFAQVPVVGETAYLELSTGSSWTALDTEVIAANSTASLSVTQTGPSWFSYRVRIAATGSHAAATSATFRIRVVDPPTPLVSVSAPAQVLRGATAAIGATISQAAVAGERLVLEQSASGAWTEKGSTLVAANSSASFTVAQPVAGSYSYRLRIEATGAHAGAVSRTFTINVVLPAPTTPTISVAAPVQYITGPGVSVTATITGSAVVGETVYLDQLNGTTWTQAASATVAASSKAALSVAQAAPATYSYRVRIAATESHKAGTSVTFKIKVIQPDCGNEVPVKADGTPWACTFNDEFNGTALDRQFWLPQVSASSGFLTGSPTQPACVIDDPQTIAVRNGTLDLTAKVLDSPVSCGGGTSSRLVSGMVSNYRTFSQTYGKFEVRAKLPSVRGNGLQETFWLWPDDVLKYGNPWPASGEIDFAEFYSSYPDLDVPVFHYLLDPATIDFPTSTNLYTGYDCAIRYGEFNTYGLEWAPGQLKVLVNGAVCLVNNYSASNAPDGSPYAPFDSPYFLALTQAFGTTGNDFDIATGPSSSTTSVDYVRIWK